MLELYTQPHAYGATEGSLHQHPQQAYDRRVRYTRHQLHRTRSTHSGFFSNPRNPVLGTSAAPFKDTTTTTLHWETQRNSHARHRQLLERAPSERKQQPTRTRRKRTTPIARARNQTLRGKQHREHQPPTDRDRHQLREGEVGGRCPSLTKTARGPDNSGDEWKQTSHGRCEQQRVTEKVRLRRWTMLDG